MSSFSRTTVAELLIEEKRLREVPPSAASLAETAVEVATQAAARRLTAHPRDRVSALSALKAIQSALAGQNFLQPPREDLWVHTLSEAMTPHAIDDPDVQEGLRYPENTARLPFIDRSKPIHWVECDMGSLFFIAVGQRLGWDIRLAALPRHNYVRWHVSPSLIVNWDWSAGASRPDTYYREQVPLADHWAAVGVFAVSLSRDTMRAYYFGQLGAKYDQQPEGVALLERAVSLGPTEPTATNNLAWAYATDPSAGSAHWQTALTYALQAWATEPNNSNYKDTVACAFEANGAHDVAEVLEREAIGRGSYAKQNTSFQKDLAAITAKAICPHGD
jgi:hypothetical protein